MNKTTFKNELIKHGFKCLQFKNEMIFAHCDYENILFNISDCGNKKQLFVYDDETNDLFKRMFNDLIGVYKYMLNRIHEMKYF